VTLSATESARLGDLVRERGAKDAARAVGLFSAETIRKAALGEPIRRDSAAIIRFSLDRI
jgi:hypothetical protein